MKAQFQTDRGQVRDHNEDSGGVFYNTSGQLLAIIADGMGGHKAGDVASEMAVSMIQSAWEAMDELKSPEETEKWLTNILSEINMSVYEYASEKEEFAGMGTTVVVAISLEDFVTIAHVGDSRCYIFNDNGFSQITEDHSLVNELVRSGQISKDEARVHPRKNVVLKAVGTESKILADIKSITWEAGNKLLLCSDGLTDKLTNEELAAFIQSPKNLQLISREMIDLANNRGGEDNISLVIIDHIRTTPVEGDSLC